MPHGQQPVNAPRPLGEKTALVTGAGRGIGAAIARRLHADGATVIVGDVDSSALASLAAEWGDERLVTVELNVADSGAVNSLIESFPERFGGFDILVNNAGINRDAMVHKMTDEQWDLVQRVDLAGVFYTSRAAARIMREQRSGRIVNIASASWEGNIGQANYAAAKAGVVGLTKTLAKELARYQVTANAICPGFIDTEMTRALPEKIHAAQLERIPLGRAGDPADVAAAVAFFAGPDAGYLTGEVLNVGGGYKL